MVEPAVEPLRQVLDRMTLNPPEIPFLSNITGDWITAEQAVDPGYWASHLTQTVRFGAGALKLLAVPSRVLLEVGPGTTLSTLVRRRAGGSARVVSSLTHPRDRRSDRAAVLAAIGELWTAGVDIDWPAVHNHQQLRRLPLPTYPFERQRFWVDAGSGTAAPGSIAPKPYIAVLTVPGGPLTLAPRATLSVVTNL